MFRSYRDTVRIPKEVEMSLGSEGYHCDMCDKGGWPSENDVEIHRRDFHSLVLNEYRARYRNRFCSVCMTLHDSNAALISHIKMQHLLSSPDAKRVERVIYICDECTRIFFNKRVLETHMLYVHQTLKRNRRTTHFACPKCSKKGFLKSIWFHLQNHEIPSVSLCDICLCNLPNRAELQKHLKTHPGYYKCEPCGYIAKKDYLFESHLKKHTLKAKHYNNVSSNFKGVFKEHKSKGNLFHYNIHNAVKGLVLPKFIDICTLCREICLSHAEIKNHILRDHIDVYNVSEKKTYLCECGEEFDYKVVLMQHVMKMKGSHRAAAETSVPKVEDTWSGNDNTSKTMELTVPEPKNVDLISMSTDHPEDQVVTGVCGQNDDEETNVMTSDIILIQKDGRTVKKIEVELYSTIS